MSVFTVHARLHLSMCAHVCVRVCARLSVCSPHYPRAYERPLACMRVFLCARVHVRVRLYVTLRACLYVCLFIALPILPVFVMSICIYICMSVRSLCLCQCVRARVCRCVRVPECTCSCVFFRVSVRVYALRHLAQCVRGHLSSRLPTPTRDRRLETRTDCRLF